MMTFKSPFLANAVSRPVLRVVGQIRCPFQAPPHLNVSGQGGPNHSPGGNSNDQKPPDHPHDALGYQSQCLKCAGFPKEAIPGIFARLGSSSLLRADVMHLRLAAAST